jgi:pimeloyl-ACP methyl ester carboxylesterase
VVLLLISAAGGTAFLFFPFELAEWKQKVELRWDGATPIAIPVSRRFAAEGAFLHGFQQNHCSSPMKKSQECVCVLLIHGSGDRALTWRKILSEPAATWARPTRWLALDAPGSGDSWLPRHSVEYTARAQSDILFHSVLESIPASECRAWMIVGNSYGGWIGAWTAVDFRDRVNKLVLVNSAGLESQKEETQKTSALLQGSVEGLQEFQKRAYFKPRTLEKKFWEKAAQKLKSMRESLLVRFPDLEAQLLQQERLDAHLSSIRANALIFWGKEDRILAPISAREFAQRIPGTMLREAPECGHLPQKECPKALIQALNEWVQYGGM